MIQKYFKRALVRRRMAAGHLSIILNTAQTNRSPEEALRVPATFPPAVGQRGVIERRRNPEASHDGKASFIPGYWSFDAARDLDWGRILELHRARGIPRQGVKPQSQASDRTGPRMNAAEREGGSREARPRNSYPFASMRGHEI